MDHVGESDSLWLTREPEYDEIIADFANFDVASFDELVFCGLANRQNVSMCFWKLPAILKKLNHKPIRINTNGLGNLVNGRDIAPDFKGLIDTISISLNTPNADRYHELVRSRFGDQSFQAMLDFAKECTQYVPNVVMTTVDTTLTKEEEAQCKAICDNLGVTYRIRPWES